MRVQISPVYSSVHEGRHVKQSPSAGEISSNDVPYVVEPGEAGMSDIFHFETMIPEHNHLYSHCQYTASYIPLMQQ